VKIWVGSSRYVVVRSWRVWCTATIYACSIFYRLGNHSAIFRSLIGLYMPYIAYLFHVSSVQELFV